MLQMLPSGPGRRAAGCYGAEWFTVLGVKILNASRRRAIVWLNDVIRQRDAAAASVFFVNAHTLNLAVRDPTYREALNVADFVFGDGTGVRWAARLQGVRMADNINGTDFVPALFHAAAGHGYSYFLLGGDERTCRAASEYTEIAFPGWRLLGYHHGYLAGEAATASAIAEINAVRPDVLLVGMGNPIQEQWIHRHSAQLEAAVCLGVGGLFDFWAGNVRRAPRWLRAVGHEWLWRLYEQPRLKAGRYLIGNPLFLTRVLRAHRFARRGKVAD
jgi:N-acetylglucosaminyldiphosphoundecaprenol N-acetyl-beta-D-mannosaminyltransferase